MPVCRQTPAFAAILLLAAGVIAPAYGEVPYDGWRGVRATQPAYAGRSDARRPLDGTLRTSQAYAPPRSEAWPAAPRLPPRADLWAGFYVGGHLGGVFGKAIPQDSSPDAVTLDGFTGGGHAGYNFQFGSIVGGLEVDLSRSGADGTRLYGGSATAAGVSLDWTGSLRGRLGVAWNDFFFYGTGGIAFTGIDLDVTTPAGFSSTHDRLKGFVYGAGVEMKIAPQISARIEALRYNFGDDLLDTTAGPLSIGADVTSIRAGLNWHFN